MLLAIIYNLLVGLVLKWFPMQVAGTKFLGAIYLGAQKRKGVQIRSGTISALAVGCASQCSVVMVRKLPLANLRRVLIGLVICLQTMLARARHATYYKIPLATPVGGFLGLPL